MKETILVIGGGILQVPLIEEAQLMGFDVICSDIDPDCACRELADRFWEIDIFDSSEHVEHAKILFKQESIQLVGCIAAGIDATETAWSVNNYIQSQTNSSHGFWANYKATKICRYKSSLRAWQKRHKFPYPQYRNKPPFIIKPVDNSGSRGIRKFISGLEVKEWAKATQEAMAASKVGKIVMEEILIGTEHTVETIWEDGKMYPAFITDRFFMNNNKYAIEAGASHPTALTKIMQNKIYREMRKLGESLGMGYGPLKSDALITEGNKIYFLEATTRYSGGLDCQYLTPLATGKNILRAAIQSNVYGKFDKDLLKAKWNKFSMSGSPFPREGTMKGYDLRLPLTKLEHKYWLIAEKGDEIRYRNSTDRVAFLIVVGNTRVEAIQGMKEGLENMRIITE